MFKFLISIYWRAHNAFFKPPSIEQIDRDLAFARSMESNQANQFVEKLSPKRGACLIIRPGEDDVCRMTTADECTKIGDSLAPYGGHTDFDDIAKSCP